MTLLGDVLSFGLGGLLILAGAVKLSSRADLSAVLKSLAPRLPGAIRSWVSRWLPWLEIVLGTASLSPWRPPLLEWAVCLLLAAFLLVSLWIALRRADLSCQCFGDYFRAGRRVALLRSLALLAMAGAALAIPAGASPANRFPELALAYLLTGMLALELVLFHHASILHRARLEGYLEG